MTPEELAAIRERASTSGPDVVGLLAEVDYLLNRIVTATNVAYVNGLMAERDRIKAAVEALPRVEYRHIAGAGPTLSAVLAAINETKESADA